MQEKKYLNNHTSYINSNLCSVFNLRTFNYKLLMISSFTVYISIYGFTPVSMNAAFVYIELRVMRNLRGARRHTNV